MDKRNASPLGPLMPTPFGQYVPLRHMERYVAYPWVIKQVSGKDGNWTVQRVEVSVDDFLLAQAKFISSSSSCIGPDRSGHPRSSPALVFLLYTKRQTWQICSLVVGKRYSGYRSLHERTSTNFYCQASDTLGHRVMWYLSVLYYLNRLFFFEWRENQNCVSVPRLLFSLSDVASWLGAQFKTTYFSTTSLPLI